MTTIDSTNGSDRAGRVMWISLLAGALALAVCIAGGIGDPGEFFLRLFAGLPLRLGLGVGFDGAFDDLPPHGRRLGIRRSPHPRGEHEDHAAGGRNVCADRLRNRQSLSICPAGNRRGKRATATPDVLSHAATLLAAHGGLFHRLDDHRLLARAWSLRQDESNDWRLAWKCQQLSGPAAVIYGITLHFAAVDWAMSIMPAFHSTIWGPLFALGQLLSALAFALIVLACLTKKGTSLICRNGPEAGTDAQRWSSHESEIPPFSHRPALTAPLIELFQATQDRLYSRLFQS